MKKTKKYLWILLLVSFLLPACETTTYGDVRIHPAVLTKNGVRKHYMTIYLGQMNGSGIYHTVEYLETDTISVVNEENVGVVIKK